MNNFKEEYVACSAIWYDDGYIYLHQPKNISKGFVVLGMRHCNCFITVQILRGKMDRSVKIIQGFMTSNNKFVDRTEAAKIAYRSSQTKELKNTLFSEDLY